MPRSRRSRYTNDYRTLLEQLAELRAAAEVTQVELAERVGTTQSMLSKLERGVVRMDILDVMDYLDGIGADPMSFFRKFLGRIEWPKPRASVAAKQNAQKHVKRIA